MSLKDKYCIVGVGMTKVGRVPGVNSYGHNLEAIKYAIEDAGLDKMEVDGVLTKAPTSGFTMLYSAKIAQLLGINPKVTLTIDAAGATNAMMVQYAMMAIDAGLCNTVVCSYGDNPRSGPPGTYARARGSDAAYGMFGAPSGYALIAQRYMREYGTTSRQLGAIAVACRKNACLNPNAQMYDRPMTIEDHQNSRLVVEPLRLLDCCLVSDGGAAVVVTSAERARSLSKPPVYIMGMGQSHPTTEIGQRYPITESGAKGSAEIAFRMADIDPQDVDVAEIYDCFTITVLMTLEEYGFCRKGEGGPFVEGGRIELGGELPINTAGGLLSETGMPGMQLIVEAVRQLRGEGEARQVKDAEIAVVSNQGGIMTTHATLVLRR